MITALNGETFPYCKHEWLQNANRTKNPGTTVVARQCHTFERFWMCDWEVFSVSSCNPQYSICFLTQSFRTVDLPTLPVADSKDIHCFVGLTACHICWLSQNTTVWDNCPLDSRLVCLFLWCVWSPMYLATQDSTICISSWVICDWLGLCFLVPSHLQSNVSKGERQTFTASRRNNVLAISWLRFSCTMKF